MVPRKTRHLKRQSRIKRPRQSGGSNHTVDLIIARYKEDLAWLQHYVTKFRFRKIIIYNKGPHMMCPTNLPNCEVVHLKNVGVCDQTYLYHIVKHYTDLADLNIFLPGSADMYHKRQRLDKIMRLSQANKPALFGFNVGNVREHEKNFSLSTYEVTDPDNKDAGESYRLAPASPRPFGLWMDTYLPGSKCPYVTYHGLFSFSKDMIHAHPASFYKPFLNQLSHDKYPEAAHYMERIWAAIVYPFPPEYFRYA